MKYSILINQRTIAEKFKTLNLADAALLAFIADAFSSPRIESREIDGHRYWWLKYSWIASEMPLLNVTHPKVIGRKMRTLREAGLIETIMVDGEKAMHRPGPRWDELTGIEAPDQGGVGTEKDPPGNSKRPTLGTEKDPPVYKGLNHDDQTTKPTPPTPPGGTLEAEFQKIPPPPQEAKSSASKGKSRDHEGPHLYPVEFQESLEFCQALADYFRGRREKRQPATPTAAELLAKKLVACGLDTATKALHTSAANGWTGVFPEKVNPTGEARPGGRKQTGTNEPEMTLW